MRFVTFSLCWMRKKKLVCLFLSLSLDELTMNQASRIINTSAWINNIRTILLRLWSFFRTCNPRMMIHSIYLWNYNTTQLSFSAANDINEFHISAGWTLLKENSLINQRFTQILLNPSPSSSPSPSEGSMRFSFSPSYRYLVKINL